MDIDSTQLSTGLDVEYSESFGRVDRAVLWPSCRAPRFHCSFSRVSLLQPHEVFQTADVHVGCLFASNQGLVYETRLGKAFLIQIDIQVLQENYTFLRLRTRCSAPVLFPP